MFVDGIHVYIKQPNANSTSYINTSGSYSLNIQALCDYKYRFMDVVIRWLGSVHNARIFGDSNLNNMLKEAIIPRCIATVVEGKAPLPVCTLGDPAYPPMPYIMKEFIGGGKLWMSNFTRIVYPRQEW